MFSPSTDGDEGIKMILRPLPRITSFRDKKAARDPFPTFQVVDMSRHAGDDVAAARERHHSAVKSAAGSVRKRQDAA